MSSQPALALVVKATFFHVEVADAAAAGDDESPFSLERHAPLRRRSRRAASAPVRRASLLQRGGGVDDAEEEDMEGEDPQSAHAPLYVADTWTSPWRRPAAPAPETGSDGGIDPAACKPRCCGGGGSGSDGSAQLESALAHRRNFSDSSTAVSWDDPDAVPSPTLGGGSHRCGAGPSLRSVPSHGSSLASLSAGSEPSLPPLARAEAPSTSAGSSDSRTTVMMRNVPHPYTRDELRELLDAEGFFGRFDFLYLPIDFRTSVVQGYAFVNLVSPQDAQRFRQHFSSFRSWGVRTGKVCNVSWANDNQQGLEANIERYRNSSVMHKSVPEGFKPMLLVGGAPAKFPKKTKRLWPPHESFGARAVRAA